MVMSKVENCNNYGASHEEKNYFRTYNSNQLNKIRHYEIGRHGYDSIWISSQDVEAWAEYLEE
jgi:hypothetical protein